MFSVEITLQLSVNEKKNSKIFWRSDAKQYQKNIQAFLNNTFNRIIELNKIKNKNICMILRLKTSLHLNL